MDAFALVTALEARYARVLDLTAEQEAWLRDGTLDSMPALLLAKAEEVDQAGALLGRLRDAPGDRGASAFRAAVERLETVIARVVAAEERCRAFSPRTPPAASRAQASAAYQRR